MTTTTNRDSLLKLLTTLRPALSTQSYIPALQHFHFDEEWVTAFNDTSAISARCGVDIKGCVPGELLLRTLSSFNAENVGLVEDKSGSLLVTSGRSKLKLPTLPVDKFPYKAPEGRVLCEIEISDAILTGIRRCLFNVGSDPTHPAQMGVTLDVDKSGHAVLFSTDNFTLSRYQTKDKISLFANSPIILPTFFCEQVLVMNKLHGDEPLTLRMYPAAIVADFGNKASIVSRAIVDIEALDFERVIQKFVDLSKVRDLIKTIPPAFDAAFGRAALVLSAEGDKACEVDVGKKAVVLSAKCQSGESEDDIDWDGPPLDKVFHVNPALVMRAIKACGSVAFLARVMVLADDDAGFIHLITHSAA